MAQQVNRLKCYYHKGWWPGFYINKKSVPTVVEAQIRTHDDSVLCIIPRLTGETVKHFRKRVTTLKTILQNHMMETGENFSN